MHFCPRCGELVLPNEAAAYGGRHEDCWTKSSHSIGEEWQEDWDSWCEKYAYVFERLPDIAERIAGKLREDGYPERLTER